MRSFQQHRFLIREKVKAVYVVGISTVWRPSLPLAWTERVAREASVELNTTKQQLAGLHYSIKQLGVSTSLDDYEQRKLGIFNQLNFFQLIIGLFIPLFGFFQHNKFPDWVWLVASLPAVISVAVLWMNAKKHYEAATLVYFICYPVMTSIVYMSGINTGADLYFILYGILSVFFLHSISHMLFSVSLSMISYFMLAVVLKDHRFQLVSSNMFLYLFNQFAGIVFIFYGLFLIKRENVGYQASILAKTGEIADKSVLLEQQTIELTELNNLKNKLFSVIAHDLKTPMYSLRNLFRTMQHQKLAAKDIKGILPDVINNLNYTTSLMDNLLHWAKSQMQTAGANIQTIDLAEIADEVIRLLQLQAAAKQLTVTTQYSSTVFVTADRDMINLVLRNLLSNAIKFTADNGVVEIGIKEMNDHAELYVRDTGRGFTEEALQKINQHAYFSTNGTAQEPGTGLGLMLCKDFLTKNNSQLFIQSSPGTGSTFSFRLPLPEATPGE